MFTHTMQSSCRSNIFTQNNNNMRKLLLSLLCLFTAVLCAQAAEQTVTITKDSFSGWNSTSYVNPKLIATTDAAKAGFNFGGNCSLNFGGFCVYKNGTKRASYLQLTSNTNNYKIISIDVKCTSEMSTSTKGVVTIKHQSTPYTNTSTTSNVGTGTALAETITSVNANKSVSFPIDDYYFGLFSTTDGAVAIESITITYDDGIVTLPSPSWTVAAPATQIKLGEGYNPVTSNDDNVTITYTAKLEGASSFNADLIKVIGDKVYPLVGGKLKVYASSLATDDFAAKEVVIDFGTIAKLPYPFGWVYNGDIITGELSCNLPEDPTNVIPFAKCGDYFTKQDMSVPTDVITALDNYLPERASVSLTPPHKDGFVDVLEYDINSYLRIKTSGTQEITVSYNETETFAGGSCKLNVTALNPGEKMPTWTFTSNKTSVKLGDELTFKLEKTVDNEPTPTISITNNSAQVKKLTVDGVDKYYAVSVEPNERISLTATSEAENGYAAVTKILTFDVAKCPIIFDWKQGETSVKDQTVQINMAKSNVPTLFVTGVPDNFATLGIKAPVFDVVSNPATGGSASWVAESTAENGTVVPAHIEISSSVVGNTTFTATPSGSALGIENYEFTNTSAAVTVIVGYPQPAWDATVPATAKVAEALDFTVEGKPAGVTVSMACKNNSDKTDASAALHKDAATDKYYFLKVGTYDIVFSSDVVNDKYVAQSETKTITVGKMPYSLDWMRGSDKVNGKSILVKTTETNLPTLQETDISTIISALPADLAETLTTRETDPLVAPAVSFRYDPAEGANVTYNTESKACKINGEGKTIIVASTPETAWFNAGVGFVTIDVSDTNEYNWDTKTNAPKLASAGNISVNTTRGVTLKGTDDTWLISNLKGNTDYLAVSNGLKFGSGSYPSTKTTISLAPTSNTFKAKQIKSIEVTTMVSADATDPFVMTFMADGKVLTRKNAEGNDEDCTFNLSGSNTTVSSKWEGSINVVDGFSIQFDNPKYKTLTITGIKVLYRDLPKDTKFDPSWTVTAPTDWKFGETYPTPKPENVKVGVSVKAVTNDDFSVDTEGKVRPLRAGTDLVLKMMSEAVGVYSECTKEVTVSVAKGDYLNGWSFENAPVNDKTLKFTTLSTTLPTVSTITLPEGITGVSAPTVSVAPQGATTDVVSYTNGQLVINKEGTQTMRVSTAGNDYYADASFDVTLEVSNNLAYSWTYDSKKTNYDYSQAAEGNITLGSQVWSYTSSDLGVSASSGIKIGAAGSNGNFTLAATAPFKNTYVSGIVVTGSSSNANLTLKVDGIPVASSAFAGEDMVVFENGYYCDDRIEICGEVNGTYFTLTDIQIDYRVAETSTKVDPIWAVNVPTDWTLGNAYELPTTKYVSDGVSLIYTPSGDDFVQDPTTKKWYPKHAGKVTVNVSSVAAGRYNAIPTTAVKINVAKMPLLKGWLMDGKPVTGGFITLSKSAGTYAVLDTHPIPEVLSEILNPNFKITWDENVIVASFNTTNYHLEPLSEGDGYLTIAILDTDRNFVASEVVVTVTVSDDLQKPTFSVAAGANIMVDDKIEIHSSNSNTTIWYTVDGGEQKEYTGAFSLPYGPHTIEAIDKNDTKESVPASVNFTVKRYDAYVAFASTVKETICTKKRNTCQREIEFTGLVSTIDHTPAVQYALTTVADNTPYTGATVDGTGLVTLTSAKHNDQFKVNVKLVSDDWYECSIDDSYEVKVTDDYVVVFDFTGENPYGLTSVSVNSYESVVKEITVEDVKLSFDGNYRSYVYGSTYDLRLQKGASMVISSTRSDLKVVNVQVKNEINGTGNRKNLYFSGDGTTVDKSTGEVFNNNPVTLSVASNADGAGIINTIEVTLDTPKELFTAPTEITASWADIEDHRYLGDGVSFPASFEGKVAIKLEPQFAVNNFDVNMGEGCKGHEAGQPNYSDCHYTDVYNEYTTIDANSFTLGVPCSGLYKMTVALKEGTECPIRYIPTPKEVTVKVLPSFNASQGENNGSPLTFNWYSTIDGGQLPIDKFHWQSVCHTLVQYHGEGTMTLWYKQSGKGIEYEGNAYTDDTHPNYQGPSAQPQSARHRVTSLSGPGVTGAEGTPVYGYTRYGADGIDFTQGEDVTLVFEKNGVYSEKIHFVACHSEDATKTGVDRLVMPEADAEYYTVDGLRIGAGEYLQPGMYVKRQGGKATLVIIR